jgi:hypothetical protein
LPGAAWGAAPAPGKPCPVEKAPTDELAGLLRFGANSDSSACAAVETPVSIGLITPISSRCACVA